MTHQEGQTSVLLDNVSALIHSKVKAQNVSLIEKFARSLYSNMPSEDLASRTDSDLYGAALSLWNSLERHTDESALIRVFNPELANITPVRPPKVNRKIKPKVNNIAESNLIFPPHNVASQLNILIPVGTAITIVAAVK